MSLSPQGATAGRDPSPAQRPGLRALPVGVDELPYRQNGTRFSAAELRGIFSNARIKPLSRSAAQWQQRLSDRVSRCAGLMLANRSRIVSPP